MISPAPSVRTGNPLPFIDCNRFESSAGLTINRSQGGAAAATWTTTRHREEPDPMMRIDGSPVVSAPLPPVGPASSWPLGWSDRDVTRSLWTTIDELTGEFGDRCSEARIIREAIGALRDLRGSTGVAALPELISRLVRVRLLDPVPSDGLSRAEPGVLPARPLFE